MNENSRGVGEGEELSFKTWLSGGKVMTNKNTWYAHLFKGRRYRRGYSLDVSMIQRDRAAHIDYWFNNRWPQQVHKLEWLVNRFMPVPSWPVDWQNPKYVTEVLRQTLL